jgi:small subunit ribosomal protein S4
LTKENWLERRLQTVVFKKGLAQSPKGARQMISHKHITIDKKIVNVPGYMVHVDEENKIEVIKAAKIKKEETAPKEPIVKPAGAAPEKVEEKPEEVKNE